MDDLISRDAAIDAFKERFNSKNGDIIALTFDGCKKVIENLPSAQPEPRWIPVEDEPSKEKKRYWVCTDTGYQCECRWTNNIYGLRESDEWGWSIFDVPQYSKVVAYMPLPTPYERSEE